MNLSVVIIEDEKPAAHKLKNDLSSAFPEIRIEAILHDMQSAMNWFNHHAMPDLIFMDIELTDGLSFQLFDNLAITAPIIFTTAYDEYWQQALGYNGIDYLLKPIQSEKLKQAIEKYAQIKEHMMGRLHNLLQYVKEEPTQVLRKNFLVRRGNELVRIPIQEMAYCYASEKVTCLVTCDGHRFILDDSLSQLEKQLDPTLFFRANRKFLVNQQSIQKISYWPKGRLKVILSPPIEDNLIISQENASRFKKWLEGKESRQ